MSAYGGADRGEATARGCQSYRIMECTGGSGAHSAGCEKRIAHESPTQSWNWISP